MYLVSLSFIINYKQSDTVFDNESFLFLILIQYNLTLCNRIVIFPSQRNFQKVDNFLVAKLQAKNKVAPIELTLAGRDMYSTVLLESTAEY